MIRSSSRSFCAFLQGVKRGDQFLILEEFRAAIKTRGPQETSDSKPTTIPASVLPIQHSASTGDVQKLRAKK